MVVNIPVDNLYNAACLLAGIYLRHKYPVASAFVMDKISPVAAKAIIKFAPSIANIITNVSNSQAPKKADPYFNDAQIKELRTKIDERVKQIIAFESIKETEIVK